MDDQDLYSGFKNAESQLKLLLTRFSELRDGMTKLLERNEELKIENQHLRELLKGNDNDLDTPPTPDDSKTQLFKSRENLKRIYDKGFHVCQQFYGQHRDANDPCMFCTEEILYRDRDKKKES